MSIRKVNKNHLKKHAGVKLVEPERIETPKSDDPLVFWTLHDKSPCEVDLRPWATGMDKCPSGRKKFKPFSGRPELIMQLLPALSEAMLYAAERTVDGFLHSLRLWWRVLDYVEENAAAAGQPMSRVTDVRLLTNIHSEAALRSGIRHREFTCFRGVVDITRAALGIPETFWFDTPDYHPEEKHIPPDEQRKALRMEIKRQCRQVLAHWELCDDLKLQKTSPEHPANAALWRSVRHLQDVQKRTGKLLPSAHELNNEHYPAWTSENLGVGVQIIRATAFPSRRDACAVFTQCLVNTAWNSSTMLTLDVGKRFLFDHFKDDATDSHKRWVLTPESYTLVGEKERAGGKEQFVVGMWKTRDGAGYLIKAYLTRVEPLRDALKAQLTEALQRYQEMQDAGLDTDVVSAQFAKIQLLKQGVRSVWLFLGATNEIDWLNQNQVCSSIGGKRATYLDKLRHQLNLKRAAQNETLIPNVLLKDFRVWFADYAYRSHFGSILAVQKTLSHSQLRTSVGYVNTNILNQEASDSARRFLDILICELDKGRVDLTILAHLHRHGPLTPEQERQLMELRALPKSRQGVGCKDPNHPPAHLQATPGTACDVQRCLLCVEHAVLLPESLDGLAMREAELRALQGLLAATVWVTERYDIELKNHQHALRRYDLNLIMPARKKWAGAIACGQHIVPGIPLEEPPKMMELA